MNTTLKFKQEKTIYMPEKAFEITIDLRGMNFQNIIEEAANLIKSRPIRFSLFIGEEIFDEKYFIKHNETLISKKSVIEIKYNKKNMCSLADNLVNMKKIQEEVEEILKDISSEKIKINLLEKIYTYDKNMISFNINQLFKDYDEKLNGSIEIYMTYEREKLIENITTSLNQGAQEYYVSGFPGIGKTFSLFAFTVEQRQLNDNPVLYFNFSFEKNLWAKSFKKELFHSFNNGFNILAEIVLKIDSNLDDVFDLYDLIFENFYKNTETKKIAFICIFDQVNKLTKQSDLDKFEKLRKNLKLYNHKLILCASNNNDTPRENLNKLEQEIPK